MKRKVLVAASMALAALAVSVAVTSASPPAGVTPTVLARGTYDAFKVKSVAGSPVSFKAKAKSQFDLVVRQHDYVPTPAVPIPTTGWHGHPGPVFITVTKGTLTYYERDDRTCSPHVVTAGHGFVDSGGGHIVRNESGQPAQDISVIVAPVGGAFRTELDAPGPYCGF
jgi:hypothetical protein